MSHDFSRLRDERVIWFYMWETLIGNQHPAIFGGHSHYHGTIIRANIICIIVAWYYGIGDIMVHIYHVNSQDHMIKRSFDFMLGVQYLHIKFHWQFLMTNSTFWLISFLLIANWLIFWKFDLYQKKKCKW